MFLQQLINGITIGSIYALVSIGFTMVFGVLELTNFANGSLYMLGAYLSLMLYTSTRMPFFLAFFLSILLTGTAGFLLDRIALRRLRNKKAPKLTALITTLGMSMIFDNFIMLVFGSETKSFPNQFNFGSFEVGGAVISWVQIIILITAIVLTVLPELLRGMSQYRQLIYGVLLVILMMVKPQGLLGDVNFKYIRQRMEQKKEETEALEK